MRQRSCVLLSKNIDEMPAFNIDFQLNPTVSLPSDTRVSGLHASDPAHAAAPPTEQRPTVSAYEGLLRYAKQYDDNGEKKGGVFEVYAKNDDGVTFDWVHAGTKMGDHTATADGGTAVATASFAGVSLKGTSR